MPLIVISNRGDTTADLVVHRATERGAPVFRINTEDAGMLRVTLVPGEHLSLRRLDSDVRCDVTTNSGVWFRRPLPPAGTAFDLATSTFIAEQWQDLIEGFESLHLRWLNRPTAIRLAENKVIQLARAQKVGLRIPPTLITNDLKDFMQFIATYERSVVKPLAGGFVASCPPEFIYATEVTEGNLPSADELRVAPVVIQRLLQRPIHYRVTIVGKRLFVAQLAGTGLLDWRQETSPPTLIEGKLPSGVAKALFALLEEFDLSFASLDLVHSDGEFYFLDLNPNGEWGWLERGGGFPISSAIVEHLCP